MILEKIRWAIKLLFAHAYVVATDKGAVVYMPYVDPYELRNITMLAGQRIAIEGMIDQLKDVLNEHDACIQTLQKESKE